MAKTINDLEALSGGFDNTADFLEIWDATNSASRKMTPSALHSGYLSMRPTLITGALVRSGSATTVVPTPVVVGSHAGYSMPIWSNPANVYEELFFREYVAGRWNGTTDIVVSILCALASAETVNEDFRFELAWEAVTPDGTVLTASPGTLEAEVNCTSGSQYALYKATFSIPYSGISSGDHLGCRLRRIAVEEAGADEVDGEVILVDCLLTYQVDKVYKQE
jgi:hypothetical protein